MLMENKFGKISRITACAALKTGKTILEDLSFTAPYKIMAPFEKENGGIQIMPLCASAGIKEGDSQEFSYLVKEEADLEVLSQSFEKIHKMDEGSASRTISVQVDPHAVLYYYPQPVIPFAQSSFTSTMTIHLADETSRLFLLEIISCGRNAHEERFQYRRFASKVQIFRGQKLIYRDNTCYEPDKMPMEGIGMYEGYTHMANLFLSKISSRDGEKCGQESGTAEPADSAKTTLRIFSLLLHSPNILLFIVPEFRQQKKPQTRKFTFPASSLLSYFSFPFFIFPFHTRLRSF